MIFMQNMQYNEPNRMYVFKIFPLGDTPGLPFVARTHNGTYYTYILFLIPKMLYASEAGI